MMDKSPSKKQILVNNFLAGLAWGFGATIGIGAILALLTYIVSQINFIPIFGNFLAQILEFAIREVGKKPVL